MIGGCIHPLTEGKVIAKVSCSDNVRITTVEVVVVVAEAWRLELTRRSP